tara:strand:- start:435 stop:1727 length:1293 start_codon:yes stop_codon:yes gene_type:complete
MLEKIKNIISKTDNFFYKKFGTHKSIKCLENIKEAQKICSHLNEIGKETRVRFVGGCVRKALSGEVIDDIDLATSLTPDEVKKNLTENNIKVIDTGISHGTVTAILNGKKFEITTLRRDISTDGRHAKVEFTLDWEKDAARRDFTINAIYADVEGRIFDPLNGISDLKDGKLKFIGSPEERIQEDYLRIIRYFRFFIHYSKFKYDEKIIGIIKKNINGINKISNERIFDELKKILVLDNCKSLFSKDPAKEIILNIFPMLKYQKRLTLLNKFNDKIKVHYDIYLILALLLLDESKDYEYFCHKYRVSNKIKNRFKYISENLEKIKNKKFYIEENIKKEMYFSSKENVFDILLFSFCINSKFENFEVERLIEYASNCKIPKFPISGDYLKNLGFESGEELGKKLKFLEEKWIKNNFVLDKKFLEKSSDKNY